MVTRTCHTGHMAHTPKTKVTVTQYATKDRKRVAVRTTDTHVQSVAEFAALLVDHNHKPVNYAPANPVTKPWPRVRPPKVDTLFEAKPGDPGSVTKDGREVWSLGHHNGAVWIRNHENDGWDQVSVKTSGRVGSISDEAQRATIKRADAFVRAGCRVQEIATSSRKGRDYRGNDIEMPEGIAVHLAECQCPERAYPFEVGPVKTAPGILARLTGHQNRYPTDMLAWSSSGTLAKCIVNPFNDAEVAKRPAA